MDYEIEIAIENDLKKVVRRYLDLYGADYMKIEVDAQRQPESITVKCTKARRVA